MRWFSPPPTTTNVKSAKPPKGYFFFAGRQWERIKWWKRTHLRHLYFYCVVLIMNNVANGFDGSMSKLSLDSSIQISVYSDEV
jgi:hypothetical protein